MIEMWDRYFGFSADQSIPVQKAWQMFESAHQQLDVIWQKTSLALRDGGFYCINIGDATRTFSGHFQLFPNHSRIIQKFLSLGFSYLPPIIWRKPTNAPNKFMGSGMLPGGAYVTYEHEYILIFRKGSKRIYKTAEQKKIRQQSAYFWEERNLWFSDIWDFPGTRQNSGLERNRTAAFPLELPKRLILMYSCYGDTVLDPFAGTGTTALLCAALGRNSLSYDIDPQYIIEAKLRMGDALDLSRQIAEDRISQHLSFIKQCEDRDMTLKHKNQNYGFSVMTRQETDILLRTITSAKKANDTTFTYQEFEVSQFHDELNRPAKENPGAIRQIQNKAS